MVELENLFIAEFGSGVRLASSLHGFMIPTCQRTIWIGKEYTELKDVSTPARRTFEGTHAYEFLLRFACGLESEIKGETDVFGQVKTAFKTLSQSNPKLSDYLQPVFQKLLEDTKEIRAQYLQGIGGNTYGALARRVLNPESQDRVLILGAGQIAKSVAPYFAEFGLQMWNRSSERLQDLALQLTEKGYPNIPLIHDQTALVQAIQDASIIILATPAGAETDELVMQYGLEMSSLQKKVLHLGGQSQQTLGFKKYPQFWSLCDLFAIEKEQNLFREKQVQQAMDACHHRAILRFMARSVSLSHGWEDLALFY